MEKNQKKQAEQKAEALFAQEFMRVMKTKDIEAFKKDYRTLYDGVIIPVITEQCMAAQLDDQAVRKWESLMMELVGEDGPGSVRTAIEKIKLESDAHLAEAMELKEKLAQAQAEIQAASMSKRDQFIAAAFQGLLAHPFTKQWSADKMAESTLKHTDALLAEIEKRNQ